MPISSTTQSGFEPRVGTGASSRTPPNLDGTRSLKGERAGAASNCVALGKRRMLISETVIRNAAKQLGPQQSPAVLCMRAAVRELLLRTSRRINFRRRQNPDACAAYDAMQIDEFTAINALQAWANWRTIPRNLSGQLVDEPVVAIDLCSGVGDSTAVLAYYCAPGSRIIGYEFNARFVEHARKRRCVNRLGRPADVEFLTQNVLETFRTADGRRVPDRSVDLVNASGAVGCHFDLAATQLLARECGRVVRPGGLALIDAGRGGADAKELTTAFHAVGFRVVRQARSCIIDRGNQLCLRKPAG